MLKLGKPLLSKAKVFFLVVVYMYVFNIDLFEFVAAISEKDLLIHVWFTPGLLFSQII